MSLLVWYPLNGDLKDKGIEGNDLINNGATVNNNGKIGKCYYFDGIDDRLYNKFNLDSEVFSIALWFKATQLTSNSQYLISLNSGNIGSAGQQFAFIITTSGVTIHAGGNYTLASYNFNVNEWYHLALTSNGTIQTLYINGNEQIEHSVGTVKGDNLTIGARSSNDAGAGTGFAYQFNGYINDVRIYDESLSKEQIHQISQGLVLHYPLNSGYGNENLMKMGGLDKNGATSMTYNSSTDTYTIVSPAGTNSWGYGVSIRSTSEISIPYGKSYRASVEVYVPTQHSFVADINNNVANGTTAWAGNDNDNTSKRTSTSFTIPANTWKKISWGSENSNGNNTDKVVILPYDKLGLRTNSDTDSVTWYLRHPKIEIGTSVTDWCPNKNDALYSTLGYDSATVYDTSGFGNDGTKKGEGLTYSENTALYDSSTVFTGNDNKDCVKCKNFLSSGSKVNEITLSCWVWCEKNQTFVGCPSFIALGSNSFIRYRMQSSTSLWAYGLVGTSNKSWQYSCSQINDGKWHNPVFTFKNGIGTLYLDGEEIGSTDYSSTATYLTCNWGDWLIGAYQEGNETWIGNISDARIYITALSAEDIKQLYESKARIDKSGNLYCNQFVEINGEEELLTTQKMTFNQATSQGTIEYETNGSEIVNIITMEDTVSGWKYLFNTSFNNSGSEKFLNKKLKLSFKYRTDVSIEYPMLVKICKGDATKPQSISKGSIIPRTIWQEYNGIITFGGSYDNQGIYIHTQSFCGGKLYIKDLSLKAYNEDSKISLTKKSQVIIGDLSELNSNKTYVYRDDKITTNEIIEI